jgi:Mg-chelatase subunit ChlD
MNASTLPRAADDDRNQVVDLNGTDYVNVTVDNGTLEVEKNTSVEYPVTVIPLANGAESGDVRSFDDDTVYRPDLDVVFVVDESGSMQWNADPSCSTACQSKLEAAQEAMKAFNGKLNQSRDRAGLVGFFQDSSDESRYHLANGRYLTDDFSHLNDTINDDLRANGGTYMHAGLRKGAALMDLRSNSSRDKVVILLSDGENSCSCHDDDTKHWAEKAAENGVTVYSIGFGNESYLNEPLLEEVANASGGSYYHAENSSELDAVFDDIAREVTETRAVTRSPMSMNLSLEGGESFYPQINGDTSNLANGTAPSGEEILNVNDPTAPERFSFSLTVEDGENVSMSAMAFDCEQWTETDRAATNASTNVTHTVVRCAEIDDSSVSAVDPSNVTVYRDGENVSALLSNDSAWWQSDLRNDTFQPYLENGTETLDLASNQAIAVFDYENTGDAHDRLIVLVEIGRPDTVEARSVVRLSISDIEVGVEDD